MGVGTPISLSLRFNERRVLVERYTVSEVHARVREPSGRIEGGKDPISEIAGQPQKLAIVFESVRPRYAMSIRREMALIPGPRKRELLFGWRVPSNWELRYRKQMGTEQPSC
jgi:hypothetical protein